MAYVGYARARVNGAPSRVVMTPATPRDRPSVRDEVATSSRATSPAAPSPASISIASNSPAGAVSLPIGRLVPWSVRSHVDALANSVSRVRRVLGRALIVGSPEIG